MTNNVNTANRKTWNFFGLVTRDGGSIEFCSSKNPDGRKNAPSMNKPRWVKLPQYMDKPTAAAWILAMPVRTEKFIQQMATDNGYTEEQVMKCLSEYGAKSVKAYDVDWGDAADEAAEG